MSLIHPSIIARKRWQNFRANRRAFFSLWLFLGLFVISLFAELIANDKPLLVRFQGEWRAPFLTFYSEFDFGGDFMTEADYHAPIVQCLILSDGNEACFDDPIPKNGNGKIIWAPIRYSHDSVAKGGEGSLQPPSSEHLFGTDGQSRDIFARVLYAFRLNIFFALAVSFFSSLLAVTLGAVMGYFGGKLDLFMQRFVEIWTTMPTLFVLLIIASFVQLNFWTMCLVVALFSWTGLVGLVRAEFLRARNFEYVRAAKALGLNDFTIMRRQVLPNAMIATITYMPFIITSAIGTLAMLDFLGFGLPASYPSLGDMAREANRERDAYWLIWTAFLSYATILSLLVFIFEGVRDAFDPRKVFK